MHGMDFNQTWQEFILRGWGFKGVHMAKQVAHHGGPGGGPQGPRYMFYPIPCIHVLQCRK